ncbi:hypothetical protein FDECE_5644 [Fusarium decemcellulare]|nr:hypothetical protein FDECE_5644 [Fusarium decemcellulare]
MEWPDPTPASGDPSSQLAERTAPVRILVQTATHLVPGDLYPERLQRMQDIIYQYHWNRDFDHRQDRFYAHGAEFGHDHRCGHSTNIAFTDLLLLGNSGAGKSNLVSQYTQAEFNPDSKTTIGVNFAIRTVHIDSKTIKAKFWDTAGQERYRGPANYYDGAVGALLVYDITNRQSYEHVSRWLGEVRDHAEADIVVMLVGNKTDLGQQRTVTTEEATKFASENKLLFTEMSALDNGTVKLAFEKIIGEIYKQTSTGGQ